MASLPLATAALTEETPPLTMTIQAMTMGAGTEATPFSGFGFWGRPLLLNFSALWLLTLVGAQKIAESWSCTISCSSVPAPSLEAGLVKGREASVINLKAEPQKAVRVVIVKPEARHPPALCTAQPAVSPRLRHILNFPTDLERARFLGWSSSAASPPCA